MVFFALHSLSFGVVTAIGSGLCYPVPLTCALQWQPDKKGTVSISLASSVES